MGSEGVLPNAISKGAIKLGNNIFEQRFQGIFLKQNIIDAGDNKVCSGLFLKYILVKTINSS